MNGQAVLFCIVVALVLQLVGVIVGIRCSRRDNYSARHVPRVLVLVISSESNKNISYGEYDRWEIEKRYWNNRINRYHDMCTNIDWKLISCNSSDLSENQLSLDCVESYIPGILQKTILGISKNLGTYDYFVRTNLSTCIDCRRLMNMITAVDKGGIMYTGGRRMTHNGITYISGTSIMLNSKAASLLVKKYTDNKRLYDDLQEFDDVVIGEILKDKSSLSAEYNMLDADPQKSTAQNIEDFKNLATPFFRSKTMLYDKNSTNASIVELFESFNEYLTQDVDNGK